MNAKFHKLKVDQNQGITLIMQRVKFLTVLFNLGITRNQTDKLPSPIDKFQIIDVFCKC